LACLLQDADFKHLQVQSDQFEYIICVFL